MANEDVRSEFRKVEESISNEDIDSLGLDKYRMLDTTEIPDRLQRDPEYSDVFDIGRSLEVLRTRLIIAKKVHNSENVTEDRYIDIQGILGEMYSLELKLGIIELCPNIQTQIKQERQRLARHYLNKYQSTDVSSNEGSSGRENENDLVGIPFQAAISLESKLTDWMYVISQEVEEIVGFTVSRDSRLDLGELVKNPSTFFKNDVWQWMDERSRKDFIEACRCLAFGSTTSSVMVALRAVERNLREWYTYDTGREIEKRTWGQVVMELEDIYSDIENRPSVLSNLDYLKDRRNAVNHPEDSPSQREAERMLYRIEGTISEIYNQMVDK